MTKKSIKTLSRVLLALSVLPVLQGCPLLLAGAAGGGALVVLDRRTLGTQTEDREIQLKANTRFMSELPDEAHISTTVFNRRVLLTGEVPNQVQKQRAEAIARALPNVQGIVNELAIRDASSLAARSKDSYLTTKVKASLVPEKNLSMNNLKVATERGIVYLMGLVTVDEGKRAADIASRVSGVRKVVTMFQYIQPQQKMQSSRGASLQTPVNSVSSPVVTTNAISTPPVNAQSLDQQAPAPISNATAVRPGNPNKTPKN